MTVYVVQNQHCFSKQDSKMVPKFDFSSAEKYGKLVFLLSPTAAPFNPESIIKELEEKLEPFTKDDYLLMVGNPVLMGLAAIIANEYLEPGDPLNFLQWSGRDRGYITVPVVM